MAFKQSIVAALMLATLVCCTHCLESKEDSPHTSQLLTKEDQNVIIKKLQQAAASRDIQNNVELENLRTRRRKRSRSAWSPYQIPQYEYPSSFTVYKQHYPISRPYFIPSYVHTRVPIYFPPQPVVLLNPGTPIDNPKKVYQRPSYPPPQTDDDNSTEAPSIANRNDFGDDDDEMPVWGSSPEVQRPPMHLSNDGKPIVRPTRKPATDRTTIPPPLVHNVNKTSSSRPARPPGAAAPIKKPTTTEPPSEADGPTTCEWAIVYCCSAASSAVQIGCFEQRGCPGPFWGASPCHGDYANLAIQKALTYYNTR